VTFDLLPSHLLRALSSASAVLDLEDGYLDVRDPALLEYAGGSLITFELLAQRCR
jgi:hypothetical protein